MELLSDHMALDLNMNMGSQDTDELELPIVETQPLQILIETSGSWDVNANSPETSTSAHGGSAKRFGFRCGEEFTCKVLIKTEFYVVYLNERLLTNSEHMVPVNSIHGLIIDGDSDIWNIAFGNPATIENFKIKDPPTNTDLNSHINDEQSNLEDVYISASTVNQLNETTMDKIKAVKSTSNLYEPDLNGEVTSQELFALSENTRKSSYQLVFALDDEEMADKERKDDDSKNDIRLCLMNDSKSKSIQNLFTELPKSSGKENQKALKLNGHYGRVSLEDGELWSIDFDNMANGLSKDEEVDQLFAFVNKLEEREEEETGKDSVHDSQSINPIVRNGEREQSSKILRPLTFPSDKSQEILENPTMSNTDKPCSRDKSVTEERRATSSGIPRLDVKYFPSLNQLNADACKKKLHNNTVKALRSGRSLGNGNGPCGPKELERRFSLPVRSQNEEHKSNNSKIPKPTGQSNSPTSPTKSQPQRLTNGHINGKHSPVGTASVGRPHNNQQDVQPKVSPKRSPAAALPPSLPSLKKGQSPPPNKPGINPKSPSSVSSGVVYRSGTRTSKPNQVRVQKGTNPSSNVKPIVQADTCSQIKKPNIPESNSVENGSVTTPSILPTPSEDQVSNSLPESSMMSTTVTDTQIDNCVADTFEPSHDQEGKPNEEVTERLMIWGSVKPRDSVNNHFSNPISNGLTGLIQTNGPVLETIKRIHPNSNSNNLNTVNSPNEPQTNGSNLQENSSNGESLDNAVSFPSVEANDPFKQTSTMNSSGYLYDLLNGPGTNPNNDIEHSSAELSVNKTVPLQKSTTSLATVKKDRSAKNFLHSPRKWLSRKLSMNKKVT